MPFDNYIQKALLDWGTGAASVTRPTGLFVGFESGTAQYSSDSPAQVFRSSIGFGAASTGATGSVTNNIALSLSCSTNCTVFGWGVYASTSGGSRLAYGTLTASHTLRAGSFGGFAGGGLTVTLA